MPAAGVPWIRVGDGGSADRTQVGEQSHSLLPSPVHTPKPLRNIRGDFAFPWLCFLGLTAQQPPGTVPPALFVTHRTMEETPP